MESSFSLVDEDTPQDVRTKPSPVDGRTMQLVFSDEFEKDDRTFYPVSDASSRLSSFRDYFLMCDAHALFRAMTPIGRRPIYTTG
jgi:hypothetical protein